MPSSPDRRGVPINQTISDLPPDLKNQVVELVKARLLDPDKLPTYNDIVNTMEEYPYQGLLYYISFDTSTHEFWNTEYINGLSSYLEERRVGLGKQSSEEVFILEEGAGNGRLTKELSSLLKQRSRGNFKLAAADNYSYNIKSQGEVEKLDYKEALEKYSPDIVICSWMDPKIDMTTAFRETPSVKEYILIGEVGGQDIKNIYYDHPGFEKVPLGNLTNLQICRLDFTADINHRHSQTISFRRIKSEE